MFATSSNKSWGPRLRQSQHFDIPMRPYFTNVIPDVSKSDSRLVFFLTWTLNILFDKEVEHALTSTVHWISAN